MHIARCEAGDMQAIKELADRLVRCGARKSHSILIDQELEIENPKRTDFRLCLS
jgi:hypothetical protein